MTLVLALGLVPKLQAQTSPPIQVCAEGKSVFAVSGMPDSEFRFKVEGGKVVDSTRLDSIVVQWGQEQGLFRIGVQEIPMLKMLREKWGDDFPASVEISSECQGEWTYIYVDVRGRPFLFTQSDVQANSGDNLDQIYPVSLRLYKNTRWFDPDGIETQNFTRPGTYQIWVEDMHGCMFTDTINMTITGQDHNAEK
ncbi:MAG: hypothetical protein FWC94_03430 [Bacteroidales bacterium]|nr:hypothetical protein [Bacteroidales bacterium]